MMKHAEWTMTASTDNAENALVRKGETGKRHVITHVSASFSAAAIKLLTIKQGSVVKHSFYVYNNIVLMLDTPLVFEQGEDVTATLAASGTGGVLGALNFNGYTI